MVVAYASAAEGSIWSFFTVTPRIIFAYRGSILPKVFPQVLLAVLMAVLAREWNPVHDMSADVKAGFTTIGFLLSFLMVFKTQSAYSQWWEAMGHVEGIHFLSRSLAMATCTILPWTNDTTSVILPAGSLARKKPVRLFARKIVRLLLVHYFVLVEFFKRTGSNATDNKEVMDGLRDKVRRLTGPREFSMLYCPDNHDTKASESDVKHASPMLVLYWIQIAVCRCGEIHNLAAPKYAIFESKITLLLRHFWEMNKIDKIQFPLPYAQVTKILCLIFVYMLPFVLQRDTGSLTELICATVALGFYGLDEVAEILEAPFGDDANDIDLEHYGFELMSDLELIYHGRDRQLDTVFDDENELSFDDLVGSLSEHQRSKHELRVISGKLHTATDGVVKLKSGKTMNVPAALLSMPQMPTLRESVVQPISGVSPVSPPGSINEESVVHPILPNGIALDSPSGGMKEEDVIEAAT